MRQVYVKLLVIGLLQLTYLVGLGQNAVIRGRVVSATNNEPVPFANVVIQGTTTGTTTDLDGNYEISGLSPGLYNLQVSYLGYEAKTVYEIQVSVARPAKVDVRLQESTTSLEAVEVVSAVFDKPEESPVSMRTIGTTEIQRYPGGNRDISKVIQALPGVASTVSFRNDIIIRGGAPNENRFYLDDIEVPVINHFSTQGASGGPVGMINVDFIKDVDFYTGAFPANRGNMLSSLMEFSLIEGRTDRLGATFTVGASEVGASLQGPLGKKSNFILSARRSYLQFLFKAFGLPFLPTYNDFQFKNIVRLSAHDDITFIGLGAIDDVALNLDENETEEQQYILGNIPVNRQWNYTIGARYRHFLKKGSLMAVVSRNHLNNRAYKYLNNDESDPNNLLLDYRSQEIENKLRLEHTFRDKGFKVNYGLSYEYVTYTNSTFSKATLPDSIFIVNFSSTVHLQKYGFFGQVSRSFFAERLTISFGLRADGSDYSEDMANPLEQLSPRVSASIVLSDQWSLNFNTGRYYQLPPYTVLGYRDSKGELVNKNNGVSYIRADHLVGGVGYTTTFNSLISVEGFYKKYAQYPFLLGDSIALANLGGDFGVIGNEPVTSSAEGRAYGVEFFMQQKLYKGFFGILSYTFVRSEFEDKRGELVPSSWDNQHLVSLTLGKKLKKNWEIGFRWRGIGGPPYTPYDEDYSLLIPVWDRNGQGLPDYDLLNTERAEFAHQLDLRIDKKYYYKKWNLNVYLDVQNVYNFQPKGQPTLTVVRDEYGVPVQDSAKPGSYLGKYLGTASGSVLPTVGVIVEL